MQDAPGEPGGLGIVGDYHDRLAMFAVQHLQQAQDFVGGLAIQIPGGLVADEQLWVGHQRARDRDTLFLTTGQFLWLVLGTIGKPYHLQGNRDILLALRRGELGQQQGQFDIAFGAQHRHQVVELEHEADVVCAPARELAAGELVDAAAADHDLPGARPIETADQIEKRRLARAGRTHQRDEVALGNVQSEAVQDLDFLLAALVHLGDAADLNHGLGHGNLASKRMDECRMPRRHRATAMTPTAIRHGLAAVTAASSFSPAGASTITASPGLTPASTWRESPITPPSITVRRCARRSFSTKTTSWSPSLRTA